MIIGKQFAEKLYSENQEEKLYSIGNEELDDLLKKAFCESYELGQREYAIKLKNPNDAISTAQKLARKKLGGTGKGYREGLSNITADQLDSTTFRILQDARQTPAVKKLIKKGTNSGLIAQPSI